MKYTKEKLDKIHSSYMSGKTLNEVNKIFKCDSKYLFKKYNYHIRTNGETVSIQKIKNFNYNFRFISNEKEAYIYGFLLADGSISKNSLKLKIHINDEDLVKTIGRYIKKDCYFFKENNSFGFIVTNAILIKNLINLGFSYNKTYQENKIPNISKELIPHFIRGYFDGDGSVYCDRSYLKANICSIDEKFLIDIKNFLLKEEIDCRINTEIRNNKKILIPGGNYTYNCKNMHRLFVSKKKELQKFYKILYLNSTIFLKRKREKFENHANIVVIK